MDKRTLLAFAAAAGILGMGAIAGCGPKADDSGAASPAAPAPDAGASPAGGAMASPAGGAMASPAAGGAMASPAAPDAAPSAK